MDGNCRPIIGPDAQGGVIRRPKCLRIAFVLPWRKITACFVCMLMVLMVGSRLSLFFLPLLQLSMNELGCGVAVAVVPSGGFCISHV